MSRTRGKPRVTESSNTYSVFCLVRKRLTADSAATYTGVLAYLWTCLYVAAFRSHVTRRALLTAGIECFSLHTTHRHRVQHPATYFSYLHPKTKLAAIERQGSTDEHEARHTIEHVPRHLEPRRYALKTKGCAKQRSVQNQERKRESILSRHRFAGCLETLQQDSALSPTLRRLQGEGVSRPQSCTNYIITLIHRDSHKHRSSPQEWDLTTTWVWLCPCTTYTDDR